MSHTPFAVVGNRQMVGGSPPLDSDADDEGTEGASQTNCPSFCPSRTREKALFYSSRILSEFYMVPKGVAMNTFHTTTTTTKALLWAQH